MSLYYSNSRAERQELLNECKEIGIKVTGREQSRTLCNLIRQYERDAVLTLVDGNVDWRRVPKDQVKEYIVDVTGTFTVTARATSRGALDKWMDMVNGESMRDLYEWADIAHYCDGCFEVIDIHDPDEE